MKKQNLSREELLALHSLRNRSDIVIKLADKGGAVVVCRWDLYKQEALKQLGEDRFYKPIDSDPTNNLQEEIKSHVDHTISTCELPPSPKDLSVDEPRMSKFYLLRKIHKPGNPDRPIVSACNCPTSNISAYLDFVMAPLVKQLPTYVK